MEFVPGEGPDFSVFRKWSELVTTNMSSVNAACIPSRPANCVHAEELRASP